MKNTITEIRSCQCEDRPCCGCDNGAFEVEAEGFPTQNDGWDDDEQEESEPENDGQPTMYEEWQDLNGGDDWDHGQFDGD